MEETRVESGERPELGDTLKESLPGLAQLATVQVGQRPQEEGQMPLVLGRYQELEEIARGGMGRILRGFDPDARREVAIKILRAGHGTSREMLRRFLAEGRVTARLEHPNIVPVHEVGLVDEDTLYFAMKLVRGRRLTEVIEAFHRPAGDGAVSLPRLLGYFQRVCDAVAFAHSKGVVHRDLKPDNIMIGEFGEVLVMDWGLAATGEAERQALTGELDEDPLKTQQGVVMGTPQYMSPEQARGDVARVDHRSDIHSLGAILYHIVTGRPPFEGATTRAVLEAVERGALVPPTATVAGSRVARELQAVVMKAMAPEPEGRYADVPGLQADVESFLGGGMVTAARYGLLQRMAKQLSIRPGLSWSAVAVVLLTVVAFNLMVLWQEHRTRQAGRLLQPGQLGVTVPLRGGAPEHGVKVKKVRAGMAAEEAGVRVGDVIVAVGAVRTPDYERFDRALSLLQPGTRTTVTVLRREADGATRRLVLDVTLGLFWQEQKR